MKFRTIFLCSLLLLIGARCNFWSQNVNSNTAANNTNTQADVQELAFTTVQSEAYSSYTGETPRLVLIQTQAAWEEFWAQQVEGNKVPTPPAPQIDFESQVILAAFTGQKNTGGYDLKITSVNTNSTSISRDVAVYAIQTDPPAGIRLTQAITSPVEVVSMERTNNFTLEDVVLVLRNAATGEQQIVLAERL